MYIAMNQFRVAPDRTEDFERAWRDRDSFLADTPGFQKFSLLRGPEEDGAVLYASHTTWADQAAFDAWRNSEAFRQAHASGGRLTGVILGPPRFVGWTVVEL